MIAPMEALNNIRSYAGSREPIGLDDATVEKFLNLDPTLGTAIEDALRVHTALQAEFPDILSGDERRAIEVLQSDFINFYPENTINPYVAIAAAGPWIITSHGAVIHDNGGYGMLGVGHSPKKIMTAMGDTHVMANVMTANFTQKRFAQLLKSEVGQKRGSCPFEKFICMNSGK